jgi:hypothetical protein
MKNSYKNEELIVACAQSFSYRQVLKRLNLKEAGGNYAIVKRKISENQIDISHFTHKGWNKGMAFKPNPKKSLDEILIANSNYQSFKLKKRLLNEGYFPPKCQNCSLETWLGNQIPLELEHIDGDKTNNQLNNLTILCPNCHALTSTYRGKNRKTKLGSALPPDNSGQGSPNLTKSQ